MFKNSAQMLKKLGTDVKKQNSAQMLRNPAQMLKNSAQMLKILGTDVEKLIMNG